MISRTYRLTTVKQSQTSISDSRSSELLDLLLADRGHPDRSTSQQQTFYRTQAESALGPDENLYRIEWIPKHRSLSIQLLGRDVVASDDLDLAEKDWATYLEKYVLADQTPGLENLKIPKPFLARFANLFQFFTVINLLTFDAYL